MPAHGFPSRSHGRARQQPPRPRPSRPFRILPFLLAAFVLAVPAAIWWGVGLSWKAMTRDDDAGRHARWTLVLDGWVPQGERVAKGLELARSGQTDSVLISGSRIAPDLWASTFQVRAQKIEPTLQRRVAELRHDATSTLQEAQAATAFFRSRGVDTVLLVTSDYHTDRAASIFARVAGGDPVYLAVPAVESRFAGEWDRERSKTWLLEASKRVWWAFFERWTTSPLDSSHPPRVVWRGVLGDSVGVSPLFASTCPPAPACPPPVECPVCPAREAPVVVPCPEPKASKSEAKATPAKKKEEAKKAPAKTDKKAEKKATKKR